MPFEDLITVAAAPKDALASISYRRAEIGKKLNPHPKLIVGIPAKYCPHNKSSTPKKDAQVGKLTPGLWSFMVGTGTDAGKARIMPSATGVHGRMLKAGAMAFRFGYVPMLGKDAAEKEFVEVRAVMSDKGQGFEIDLPPWFKA